MTSVREETAVVVKFHCRHGLILYKYTTRTHCSVWLTLNSLDSSIQFFDMKIFNFSTEQ